MRGDFPRRVALGPNFLPAVTIVFAAAAIVTYGFAGFRTGPGGPSFAQAAEPAGGAALVGDALVASPSTASTSTSTSTSSTTTSTSTTTTLPEAQAPPPGPRYTVAASEAEPEAKQLAVDIAWALTNYHASDDHSERLGNLAPVSGVEALLQASEPLTHAGSWSRGEVVYPQMGGLTEERASVMVVTRQTVGSGSESEFSVVRTLDIRLVRAESGWRFDFLSSAGGTFDRLEDLAVAHAVARDPRIAMPDSARLDILNGLVSPKLLGVMAELADRTSYSVVVLATGHPHNVFETDRQSDHTKGRAVDISAIGDRLVIDDRHPNSATWAIVEWLYNHSEVIQVGSPWDLDGPADRRSFTNVVHQDHIHLAVVGEG